MGGLFEYSDILQSPIEAFYCKDEWGVLPVEAHWHYFVEWIYMKHGSVMVSCNEETFELKEGSFIVLPPQTIHAVYSDHGRPFQYICCKFNLNKVQLSGSYLPNLNFAFRGIANLKCPPVVFAQQDIPQLDIDRLFTEVVKEVQERRYGYNEYVYAQFSLLILKMMRCWKSRGIRMDSDVFSDSEDQTVQDVLVYIDAHSNENINIEELAHHYHMSYSYFAKLFHKYYGQSCKQYIEFVRLSKVENLLLFTDYDLNYIAEETGFADCSHLIRSFKKRYRTTPKQYRLRHQETDAV